MIFIGLFAFIAIVILGLNIYNSSNLSKIEEYLKNHNCKNYIYSKGSYKAICEDKILDISNSFILDIKKNKKLYNYADIKSIKIEKSKLIINNEFILLFSKENDLNKFSKALNSKIKQ